MGCTAHRFGLPSALRPFLSKPAETKTFGTDGQALLAAQPWHCSLVQEAQQAQRDRPQREQHPVMTERGHKSFSPACISTKTAGPKQPGSWSKRGKEFGRCFIRRKERIRSFLPQTKARLVDIGFFCAACCRAATVPRRCC